MLAFSVESDSGETEPVPLKLPLPRWCSSTEREDDDSDEEDGNRAAAGGAATGDDNDDEEDEEDDVGEERTDVFTEALALSFSRLGGSSAVS